MRINARLLTLMLLSSMFLFNACNKSDDNGNNPNNGQARVAVRLTDAPAAYDAIYLDIQQVNIIYDNNTNVTVAAIRPGIYDLLALRNGLDTLLVNTDVPAGTISQIRLVLGPNNSIVVNGTTHSLNTPSAQESGLKLNLHETLTPGGSYAIWLDFDASKSILQTGNGQYKLKPVIRAYTAATDGRIKGYVLPLSALATVYAINGTDTFGAIPNSNGFYQLSGLPNGTYTVLLDANAGTFTDVSIPGVQVTYGQTTDLGIRTLLP